MDSARKSEDINFDTQLTASGLYVYTAQLQARPTGHHERNSKEDQIASRQNRFWKTLKPVRSPVSVSFERIKSYYEPSKTDPRGLA